MQVKDLTYEQRTIAVQRLTALWAFSESGLGGVLHALHIPFTGLVVGGFSILIITLIAFYAYRKYSVIFQSFALVLLVKAIVSPHTPFPAYIAVSFQAAVGFLLFSLFRVNWFSILLLSLLAMVESAIQKLLVLTFFFGKSIWIAADELLAFINKQLHLPAELSSSLIISIYLGIYVFGGIVTGLFTYRLLQQLQQPAAIVVPPLLQVISPAKKKRKQKWLLILAVLAVIVIIFLLIGNNQSLHIPRILLWTTTAIITYYLVITPLMLKMITALLKRQTSAGSLQLQQVINGLPHMRSISYTAWKYSASSRNRLFSFVSLVICWTLTYTPPDADQS